MKACKKSKGQVTVEFVVAAGLVLFPFVGMAGFGFKLDWEKSKCVYQSFQEARDQLLLTHQVTTSFKECSSNKEQLTLVPLEDLDQNKGGLDLRDFQTQVSHSWDRFSSLQSASSAQD